MRAVILAAGAGRRLAGMGWKKPKCLLPCPQGTLLDNTLQCATSHGISEVAIVAGYEHQQLMPVLCEHSVTVRMVMNEDFATTNTIHSLWLARQYLGDGCLIFNGDVWFEHDVVQRLLDVPSTALAVEVKPCGPEEVKVVVDSACRITAMGKDIAAHRAFGEYIGVAKLNAVDSSAVVTSLEKLADRKDLFYEAAFDAVLSRVTMTPVPIGTDRAIEIDTPEDYQRAQSLWKS